MPKQIEKPAAVATAGGLHEGDQHCGEVDSENRTQASDRQPPRLCAMLELFTIRAVDIFGSVLDGRMALIDGADLLQDAAIASGLADRIGIDALQKLLSACIATAAHEGDSP